MNAAGETGKSNGEHHAEDLSIDEDEVLSLNLPSQKLDKSRHLAAATAAENGYQDGDRPASTQMNARVMAAKQRNKDRDLLPLSSAKTSRFDRPIKKSKAKEQVAPASDDEAAERSDDQSIPDAASKQSASESEGEQRDQRDDIEEEDWMRAGGYHVTKREMERLEDSSQRSRKRPDDHAAERDALELYEARRIQREGKATLAEEDYGLGELCEDHLPTILENGQTAKPAAALVKFASKGEAIAHLVATEPELLALLDDLTANADRLAIVRLTVKQMQLDLGPDNPKVGFAVLYQGARAWPACF